MIVGKEARRTQSERDEKEWERDYPHLRVYIFWFVAGGQEGETVQTEDPNSFKFGDL